MKENNLELENAIDLMQLNDDELIDFLFTEEDFLTRDIVNEFLRRGERMIEPLWNIIKEENSWNGESDWWPAIHSTYIIGTIGGENAIIPLIASLRFADFYNCDWLTEFLPSIFGKIGPIAIEPLKKITQDRSNNWMIRTIALDGLAAITIANPKYDSEIFDFIVGFLKDSYEERIVRGLASDILLDFKKDKYQKNLLAFAEEEEEIKENNPDYIHHLDVEFVYEILENKGKIEKDLYQYTRDWLEFYDEKEIQERKKQWKKENTWWGFIWRWRDNWQFKKRMARIDKEFIEKEKANILPLIKLKYFQHNDKQHKNPPIYKDIQCNVCNKKNVRIGSFADTKTNNPKIICEDCAIKLFKKEHHFLTYEAAVAKRRRIFDVLYLFQEMAIDEYLKRNKLNSLDDLIEGKLGYLVDFASREYNRLFSKQEKIKLETTREQKEIEDKFSKIISSLDFHKYE